MSEDDDGGNVTYLDVNQPPKRERRGQTQAGKAMERAKREIPVLPPTGVEADDLDLSRDMTERDLACVNMRLMGAPFSEIAKALEYKDAAAAQRDFTRALAATHTPEDWDTMRQLEVMRAEQLMRRSFTMAAADFLIDQETGEKIPNVDKLKWHEQAGKDLALHATISGAKAPIRVDLTPTEQEYSQIVDAMLSHEGFNRVIEADIIDAEEIPDGPKDAE